MHVGVLMMAGSISKLIAFIASLLYKLVFHPPTRVQGEQ